MPTVDFVPPLLLSKFRLFQRMNTVERIHSTTTLESRKFNAVLPKLSRTVRLSTTTLPSYHFCDTTVGRPEACGRPGQANNLASLQIDIL